MFLTWMPGYDHSEHWKRPYLKRWEGSCSCSGVVIHGCCFLAQRSLWPVVKGHGHVPQGSRLHFCVIITSSYSFSSPLLVWYMWVMYRYTPLGTHTRRGQRLGPDVFLNYPQLYCSQKLVCMCVRVWASVLLEQGLWVIVSSLTWVLGTNSNLF